MILSITGFMGCGKSRVGEKLSGLLSCPVIDLDRYIETKEGRRIPEIFAASGEKAFRLMEKEALGEILSGAGQDTVIISLGGGTVTTPECAEAIREKTLCIYLRATVDTLVGNLQEDCEGRPMLARNGGSASGSSDSEDSNDSQIESQIQNLQGQLAALQSSGDSSSGEIAALQAQIASLKAQLS